jgi:NAD+ kinase
MNSPLISLHSVAVAAHPQLAKSLKEAVRISNSLRKHAIQVTYSYLNNEGLQARVASGEVDLLIAIGGDGSMLRAGHLAGPAGVPILGINMGRFGFLTEILINQWNEILPRLLTGDYRLETRMMLRTEQWRGDERIGAWDVLNEVAVGRGQMMRPVRLTATVDGRFLTTYVADVLIAATPTGSTAYALAAGGPILPPELRNILLIPVAPHLSIDRAIILSEGSTVGITVNSEYQAELSIDGQTPVGVNDGDRIEACASEHTVRFVRFQDPGYFYRNLTPHMNQNPSTGNQR